MDEWAGARLMAYEELGLRVDSVTWDLGALSEEMKKKDEFWLEKYNDLHETVTKMAHAMGVAIGIRNAKINEQAGYITHLKGNVDKLTEVCYTLSDKITTLEQQLKKLTEQVDLNSQTLEALQ